MRRTSLIIAAAVSVALVLSPAAVASQGTAVQQTLRDRRAVADATRQARRAAAEINDALRDRITTFERLQRTAFGGLHGLDDRRSGLGDVASKVLSRTRDDLRTLRRRLAVRIEKLRSRAAALEWWLDTVGIFRVCPVPGYTEIHNDFGEIVRLPKVPVHRHTGSDIVAPTGSAILAPFDGYASVTSSKLGGLEVRIAGDAGYVYNGHAAAVGTLGWVRAGTVIGYVGATGDATGPHDHLEWHPDDGLAVDPYPLLVAACVGPG